MLILSEFFPVFLQVTGQTEVLAAALVIPFLLMAAASSILSSYISERTGWARPLFIGALIILPIGEGLMSTLTEKSSIGRIVGYSLICGFGFGGVSLIFYLHCFTPVTLYDSFQGTQLSLVIAQVGLKADLLPTVTALISATPNLGGVLGVGIIGTGMSFGTNTYHV